MAALVSRLSLRALRHFQCENVNQCFASQRCTQYRKDAAFIIPDAIEAEQVTKWQKKLSGGSPPWPLKNGGIYMNKNNNKRKKKMQEKSPLRQHSAAGHCQSLNVFILCRLVVRFFHEPESHDMGAENARPWSCHSDILLN